VTRDQFLTVRWNNVLSLGLGLITLTWAVVALSTSTWADRGGFIGLVVIGVFF